MFRFDKIMSASSKGRLTWSLPVVAAIVGLAATYWSLHATRAHETARDRARFDVLVERTQSAIKSRTEACELLLRGANGLFAASTDVTRDEWRRYVTGLGDRPRALGMSGVVFIERVPKEKLSTFVAAVRADDGSDFAVWPEGIRDEYRVIRYSESDDANQTVRGYDVGTRDECKEAMNRACDTGRLAITAKCRLVQDRIGVPSIVAYIPVYRCGEPVATVAQRRVALRGWVGAPIRVSDLASGPSFHAAEQLDFEIFDGVVPTPENLLYDHDSVVAVIDSHSGAKDANADRTFSNTALVEFGGRPWAVQFSTRSEFDAESSGATPWLVGLGGLTLTGFLVAVIVTALTTRVRALALAEEMTQSLRHSEAKARKLALVADRTDNAVVLTDRDGRITWVNQGFTRITEYTLTDVAGKRTEDVLHGPDTDPSTVEYMRRQLAKGEGYQDDVIYYSKSGRRYWLSIEVQPVRDECGNVTHFMAMQSDITARKKTEAMLVEQKQLLRRHNEVLSDLTKHAALFETDLVQSLRLITEAAASALNTHRTSVWLLDDMRSAIWCKHLFDVRSPEHSSRTVLQAADFPTYFEALRSEELIAADDALQDPRTQEFSEVYLRPLGITSMLDVPIRCHGRVIGVLCHEHTGEPRRWSQEEHNFAASLASLVSLVLETNSRRIAEEALKDTVDEIARARALLEKQTDTLRLQNRELEEARSRAVVANRAKSEFLANMSHEIRTPMTAILGFADLLLAEDLEQMGEDDRRDALQTIKSNGHHLLQIVNDILDLSKIESGKLGLELDACNPAQVLQEVLSLMQPRADAKRIDLSVSCDPSLPKAVSTDVRRLRQILINLVGNAIKFTESGSVRLTACALLSADTPSGIEKGPKIQIDVIDTGIGIAAPHLETLFQPFQQGDSSTTRKFGGTGLGLAISQRLAGMLGGEITAESTPGVGSRFRLSLTTKEVVTDLDSRGTPEESKPTRPAASSALHGRVLVAEDGPDNVRLITMLLQKNGAEVSTVENGELAVEAAMTAHAAGMPFDCILMDMQMPVMDGYQATRRLREKGYTGTIIALTANAMSRDREKCMDAGCDDYAPKPIDRHELIRMVAEAMARSGPTVLK